MIIYVLLLGAAFRTAFGSNNAKQPNICSEASSITCNDPAKLIPWTECGSSYTPACDAKRCCTTKLIYVDNWSDDTIDEAMLKNSDIHIDAVHRLHRFSLLVYAIDDLKFKIALDLIDRGASVNLKDNDERTPLMYAARAGNLEVMEKLLHANAFIALTDRNDLNALAYAVQGSVDAVRFLLNECLEVNDKALELATGDMWQDLEYARISPLIGAVVREDLDGLEYMLSNNDNCVKADETIINSKDEKGWTALTHATNLNNMPIFDLLREYGAEINEELIVAAGKGYLEMGKKLLKADAAKFDAKRNQALVAAVETNHLNFVDFLLEKGASADALDSKNQPVLIVAVKNDSLTIVESLLGYKPSVDKTDGSDQTALVIAVQRHNEKIVEALLDYGASVDTLFDVDGTKYSPLTWASEYGIQEVAEHLLDACADIDIVTGGKTALAIATNRKEAGIVKALERAKWPLIMRLLDKKKLDDISAFRGTEPCYKGDYNEEKDGSSLLTYAVQLENVKITKQLIDLEADINAKSGRGMTVLMRALTARNCVEDIVKRLVNDEIIDINAIDDDHKNALMHAVEQNCKRSVVDLLVKHPDIKINAVDKVGQTALMQAVKRCSEETDTIPVLLKHENIDFFAADNKEHIVLDEVGECDKKITGLIFTTALMQAVAMCDKTKTRRTVENHATDVNAKYSTGQTVLIRAVQGCDAELVGILLAQEELEINAVDSKQKTALMHTMSMCATETDTIRHLLAQKDINVFAKDDESRTVLDYDMKVCKAESVDLLFTTALKLAVKTCIKEFIDDVLDHNGINVNARESNRTYLMRAVVNCDVQFIRHLLKHGGIDVNAVDSDKQTAVMEAINDCKEKSETVGALLGHDDININATDKHSQTVLMQALKKCDADIGCGLLTRPKIDISGRDENHRTVLMLAVEKCEVKVLDHLRNTSNVNINDVDNDGRSALMIAVNLEKSTTLSIVRSLLEYDGVKLNLRDNTHKTALRMAVDKMNVALSRCLLGKGADPNILYGKEDTVLSVALMENNEDMVRLLLDYRAYVDDVPKSIYQECCSNNTLDLIDNATWPLRRKIANKTLTLNISEELAIPRKNFRMKKRMERFRCMGSPLFPGKSMWMVAAEANNTDVMKQLIALDEKHALTDMSCATGESPLCTAVKNGFNELVEMLLEACADLDLRCHAENFNISSGAYMNNSIGKTVLQHACESNNTKAASIIRDLKWPLVADMLKNMSDVLTKNRTWCEGTPAARSSEMNVYAITDQNESIFTAADKFNRNDIVLEALRRGMQLSEDDMYEAARPPDVVAPDSSDSPDSPETATLTPKEEEEMPVLPKPKVTTTTKSPTPEDGPKLIYLAFLSILILPIGVLLYFYGPSLNAIKSFFGYGTSERGSTVVGPPPELYSSSSGPQVKLPAEVNTGKPRKRKSGKHKNAKKAKLEAVDTKI